MTIEVVNLRDYGFRPRGRATGGELPPGVRRVDRATVLGNPFRIGAPEPAALALSGMATWHGPAVAVLPGGLVWDLRDEPLTRDRSIELYRHWVESWLDPGQVHARRSTSAGVREAVESLRGADALACWCAPLACHADVLAEILDRPHRWVTARLGSTWHLVRRREPGYVRPYCGRLIESIGNERSLIPPTVGPGPRSRLFAYRPWPLGSCYGCMDAWRASERERSAA